MFKMKRKLRAYVGAFVCLVGCSSALAATNYTFLPALGASEGDWGVPGNWFPNTGSVPGADPDDTVTINNNKICNVTSDQRIKSVTITDGN